MNEDLFFNQSRLHLFDDRKAVADRVSKDCTAEARCVIEVADLACNNTFLFQQRWDLEKTTEPVVFEKEIDWLRQPGNDPEFVYAFNRMKFWICMGQAYAITGDEKYAKAFTAQLVHWVDTVTPEPAHAKAWRSIEMGFRMDYWCRAIHYFQGSPYLTPDVIDHFIQSMRTHMEKIMAIWDPFQLMSNWGILANHGMFMASLTLPEDDFTINCQKEALRRLDEEIRMQYYPDGIHWEQSPMYHNEMLHCCLDIVLLARRNGIALPGGFESTVHKMASASLAMIKPDCREPMMGDSDDIDCKDIFTVAAYVFDDAALRFAGYPVPDFDSSWMLGMEGINHYLSIPATLPPKDFCMLESGNFTFRSGWSQDDTWVRFHCGTLGAGHGHADQLHFDLTSGNEDILTDIGRFTYVYGPDRIEFKSGKGHNTVLVDGKDFYETKDSWECSKLSQAINRKFYADERYGYCEGGHLGYYRDGVYINRRLIFIKPDILIICDEYYTAQDHRYRQYYHWGNDGTVQQEGTDVFYRGTHVSAHMKFVSFAPISLIQSEGRISRHYNSFNTIPVTEAAVTGSGFTSVFSIISTDAADKISPFTVEKVPVYSTFKNILFNDSQIEAVRIEKNGKSWLLAVGHEEYASPTDTFTADGCLGFGNVVIFEKSAGEDRIGTRLSN